MGFFWPKKNQIKKPQGELPIQSKPMYVVGRLKGVILHHSSLNFTNLNVLSGGKNCCTPPLICDVKSACSLSFHQPQLFRKMRLLLESQKQNGMRFPSPHCPGDIWCVLTNIAVGYNIDSSITGIKCLECNLEILPHHTEKLLWGKKKKLSIFSGCYANLVLGQGIPGTVLATER